MRLPSALITALILATFPARADERCEGAEAACEIDGGEYYAMLPADRDGAPWVVYLHGFGGSASSTISNEGFVAGFTGRGYALIVPQGLPIRSGAPTGWSIRDAWIHPRDWEYPRDDVDFVASAIADAVRKFGLDPARGIVAGFSDGGAMTWDIACLQPTIAAAYAPVAGGFWEPMAESCAGPVHLQHTHGFSDTVFPLEGREVRMEGFAGLQSDVHDGLQLWRQTMGCRPNADGHTIENGLWYKRWTGCTDGSLELVLHPGGHRLPDGWTGMMLDWFEGLPVD